MMRKVHLPRYSRNAMWSDPPIATFHPKTNTYFSCRSGALFMRKWRGPRRRGQTMVGR